MTEQERREKLTDWKNMLGFLLERRDHLLLEECPDLEARYVAFVGVLEYQGYDAYVEAERLQRKIKIVRELLEQGKLIDLPAINRRIDEEMKQYERRLSFRAKRIERAVDYVWSPEKKAGGRDPEQLEKLYEKSGIPETMMELAAFLKEGEVLPETLPAAQEEERQARFESLLGRIQTHYNRTSREIFKITHRFPYTRRELLDDEKALKRRQVQLSVILRQYQVLAKRRREELFELLNSPRVKAVRFVVDLSGGPG